MNDTARKRRTLGSHKSREESKASEGDHQFLGGCWGLFNCSDGGSRIRKESAVLKEKNFTALKVKTIGEKSVQRRARGLREEEYTRPL